MSCRYSPPPNYCTSTEQGACAANPPPTCLNGAAPNFNTTTCCRQCVPPSPPPPCTDNEFVSCINALAVCANGESSVQASSRCCGTCRRPERACTPDQVALCVVDSPFCNGSTPVIVDGDCCPSCRPDPPVCNPPCSSSQICIRSPPTNISPGSPGTPGPPVCKPRLVVSLLFNSSIFEHRQLLCNLTQDQLRELIFEVVQRFCDNPNHASDCTLFKTTLLYIDLVFSANFIRDRCENDGVRVDVGCANGVTDSPSSPSAHFDISSFRTFAASSTSGTVVESAATDSEAPGGVFNAQGAGTTDLGAATNVGPSLFLVLAALIGFLF